MQMSDHAFIRLTNGLGDKLLDCIGFFVLCKNLNYKPFVSFVNNQHFQWGSNNYDERLFNFQEILITDTRKDFEVVSPNPSSSLCPIKVYEFLKNFMPNITFEQVSNDFVEYSREIIRPSDVILSRIPKGIENAYGIHLRKSDKVKNSCDIRHENLLHEFDVLVQKLLEDIEKIIISENDPTFLLVSEDDDWKKEFREKVLQISSRQKKAIQILDINYNNDNNYQNLNSVVDMFCLSKCKEILQGVKYSTFSILASLLGRKNLRNYSQHLSTYNICLTHSWSSAVNINSNLRNFDIEFHKEITKNVYSIFTNITKKLE